MIRHLWPLRLACRLVVEADELRAELAEQTAETWRMRADRDYWLNAWGHAGDEHTQAALERDNLRDELASAEEQRDRWEHGARSNFAALTDARGRVAVLEGQQAALVDGHARELAQRLSAERVAGNLSRALAASGRAARWAPRWKALARRLRGEIDTWRNLEAMAIRERDAAREAGAAEAFALREELAKMRQVQRDTMGTVDSYKANGAAWHARADAAEAGLQAARAEAERLSAELRRVDPAARREAAAAPVACCYCGKLSLAGFTLDHVLPLCRACYIDERPTPAEIRAKVAADRAKAAPPVACPGGCVHGCPPCCKVAP